jgi:hypothetical protein
MFSSGRSYTATPPHTSGSTRIYPESLHLVPHSYRVDCIYRSRAWKTNLILVLQAALFMMLTWGIDVAVKASNQRRPAFSSVPVAHPKLVGPIPDCADNMFMRKNKQCYTLLYAPKGVPEVDEIIAAVAARNEPPIPSQHVKGFANGSSIDLYLLEHWNTVLAAVEFVVDGPQSIGFSVMTNSSVQWFKGKFQDPNLYAQLPVQGMFLLFPTKCQLVHDDVVKTPHTHAGVSLDFVFTISHKPFYHLALFVLLPCSGHRARDCPQSSRTYGSQGLASPRDRVST